MLEKLYSLVCLVDSLQITIVLAAAFGLAFSLLDIINAFQNTILAAD